MLRPSRLAAFAAFIAVPLLPAAAVAATANALQTVNVRSGPAATFGVVGQLQQGDAVDISKCQGAFCYVTFANAKAGWVSASYLTRDHVQKAPSTTPIPNGPVIASAKPNLPKGSFPPAYTGGAPAYDNSPSVVAQGDTGYDNGGNVPPYRGPGNGSIVTLPPDSGDVVASTDGPRPQVDIPDVYNSNADSGDGPVTDNGDPIAPDDSLGAPPPDWNRPGPGWHANGGRFGVGARFAALDRPGMARACFFGSGGDQADFCLGAGQSMSDFGNLPNRIFSLRNPRGLKVTICGVGASHTCRIFESSGPVTMPDNVAIASISVDPPDGY
ncbi:MAG: SH3 domain-containing protein [Devosia sp.]